MKNIIKRICAVSLCAVMVLSGCGQSAPDKSRPTTYRLIQSKDAGNSGEVTLNEGDTYAVISVKDYGDITIKLYPDEAPYAVYNFVELAKAGTYNGRNFHRVMADFMIQGGSSNGAGGPGDAFEGGSFRCEVNTSLRHYYGALCMASSGGDQSDQFYIVNSKVPQTTLKAFYEQNSAGAESQSEMMNMYLQLIDPSDESMKMYYNYYSKQKQFYIDYSKGAKAMAETITDAVLSTYEEKGGSATLDGGYTVFGQTVSGFEVIDAITAVEVVDDGNGNITKPAEDVIIEKVEIFTK